MVEVNPPGENLELVTAGDGDGLLQLRGPLDFTSVPGITDKITGLIAGRRRLTLDLSGVTGANSAGLALLLELKRVAAASGCRVRFQHLPDALVNIIRISELTGLLADSES